jgi:hypothetical protein
MPLGMERDLERHQFLVYVDNVNLMGESISTIRKSEVHTPKGKKNSWTHD